MTAANCVEKVNVSNASDPVYRQFLESMAENNECPFDDGIWQRYTPPEQVVWEGEDWALKHARQPYPRSLVHLLAFPVRHITNYFDLTDSDMLVIMRVPKIAFNELGLAAGGLITRLSTGDGTYTQAGGSVAHLHAHFIVPLPGERVWVPIGSVPVEP